LLIQILLWATFSLAAVSGINTGIITSLFTTSLVFTGLYFYFVYGQKLTTTDIFGIVLVCACVVIISLSGDAQDDSLQTGFSWEKFGAIVCSIGSGVMFAVNTIDIHVHLT
jgi:drug/metabolite transporter (DMT)-like permease